jgi:membrane protease YdiL (CAAX protease family)
MKPLLPAPAPETAFELAMGRRSLASRLGRVAIATAVMVAILIAPPALRRDLPVPSIGLDPGVTRGLFAELLLLTLVVVLVAWLAGLGNIGLRVRGAQTSLILSVPLVGLGLLDGMPSHYPDLSTIAAVAVWGVLIGLTEEMYGRGLLITLLGGRRHAALAIIGSAIGFAYLHVPGYAQTYGWRYALLRSTASAAFSASGAVIRLRSGSILGLVAFHALDDTRSILAGFHAAPSDRAADADASFLRVIVFGCVWSTAYWLLSRRPIRRAAAAQDDDAS